MKRLFQIQFAPPLLAALIGALVFFGLFSELLHPTYIAWILDVRSDPFQHFASWLFFESGPWSFPLSAPTLTYPIGTSIVFTDSIPLFALLFKLLSNIGLLPAAPIQYFGIWLLVAFVLQTTVAYFLIKKTAGNSMVAVIGSTLFALSAPMLLRMTGHFALSMHALLLIAILLYSLLNSRKKWIYWGILFIVTLLTHAYLFVMVGAIYTADLLRQWIITKELRISTLLKILGMHIVLVLGVMWSAGYFTVGSSGAAATEFERFSMNLIAIINPNDMSGQPWSQLLPVRGIGPGQFEGANFLGIAVLVQLLVLLIGVVFQKDLRQNIIQLLRLHTPLILISVLLTLFALSTRIWFGPYTIIDTTLPALLEPIANTFRSSGRFFWPVLYLLMLLSFIMYRYLPKRLGVLFVTILVLVQLYDMWPRLMQTDRTYANISYTSSLQDPFWNTVPSTYDHIVLLPGFIKTRYEDLSFFAATHDMTINDFMLARTSPAHIEELKEQQEDVRIGRLDAQSLYIVVDYRPDLYITTSTRESGTIQKIDDYIIITAQ
jgi:hypothetical protein